MRAIRATLSLLAALLLAASAQVRPDSAPSFTVSRLAEGVYAIQKTKPAGYLVAANNLVIVNDEDVVVVDTDMTMEGAGQVIDAIRRLTSKPVRFVVNTHWHDDHVIGNRAFVEAYPGVEFIAHAATVKGMTADAVTMRKTALKDWPGVMAEVRALVEKGTWTDGTPLTPSDAAILRSDLDLGTRYLAQIPDVVETLPTVLVEDRLVLQRGSRTIDIRFMGVAATEGDLVVYLPEEGIVATGDLVTWPVIFGAVSSVAGWARARLVLDRYRDAVSSGSRVRAMLFDAYFTEPVLPIALEEARKGRG